MSGPSPSAGPRVSVVMPFLDAERFIEEAIDSVLRQTLSDWELLLVDDGSTDASARIVGRYCSRFPDRLRALRHADGGNHGIAASRNRGFDEARGRYIALLDADDVYQPRRLEAHVARLDQDDALGVVISPDVYWRSWLRAGQGVAGGRDQVIAPAAEAGRRYDPPALIASTLLTRGAPMPSPCSITFRADAIRRLGGIPEEFPRHYEDQVLVCKLLLSCAAMTLDEPLSLYRQHAASLTRGNAGSEDAPGSEASLARGRFLAWLRRYLGEIALELPELERWIDSQLAAQASSPAPARDGRRALRSLAIEGFQLALPAPGVRWLGDLRHRLRAGHVRRKVMRRIRRFERNRSRSATRPSPGAIRAYWNERVHDVRLSDDPVGTAGFHAALDEYHLRRCAYLQRTVEFERWSGCDVLEVGCGAGLDLVRFARAGARTTGVDIASTAIGLARSGCRAAGVSANLIEARGERLPLAPASFDLVCCLGVIPFGSDPAAIVAEAHRVLRPGGQAIFMVYHRHSWMGLVMALTGRNYGHTDAPGFTTYSRPEFERLLAPFPDRRLQLERYPMALDERRGIVGTMVRALPATWWRPFGWHLVALCRKGA